jgi:D-sedoheptulose 7-phosphate isomerase
MDEMKGMRAAIAEHVEVVAGLVQLEPSLTAAAAYIARSLKAGGKLMLCGNGGSAADCQHLAAEFVGRFSVDRAPLAAIALTTDSSALTAIGNDFGFEEVFARQVAALGRPGDVLLAISTSGRSENVRHAVMTARGLGVVTIGLLGGDRGTIAAACDWVLTVRSRSTARIQEAHILLGHVLCGEVERLMGVA